MSTYVYIELFLVPETYTTTSTRPSPSLYIALPPWTGHPLDTYETSFDHLSLLTSKICVTVPVNYCVVKELVMSHRLEQRKLYSLHNVEQYKDHTQDNTKKSMRIRQATC